MATTPKMGMDLPVPSETQGPRWAEKINNALELRVDAHDHSEGKGARIPVAGLDIDADLSLEGHNLDDVRMARFGDQGETLAGGVDIRGLYVVGGDLYYNNGNGTPVRLTEGNALAFSTVGAIEGLPSIANPDAKASWEDAVPGFSFYADADEFAKVRVGELLLHELDAESPKAVTIKSPASLASGYSVEFPASLPGASSFLTWGADGKFATGPAVSKGIDTANLADEAVTTAKIADLNVTRAKLVAVGQQVSDSSGSFNGTVVGTNTDITNLSVTITTTGRPVMLFCAADGSGNASYFESYNEMNTKSSARILIYDSATLDVLARYDLLSEASSGSPLFYPRHRVPPSALTVLHVPVAGTYTFKVAYLNVYADNQLRAFNMRLVAYEL